MSCVFALLRQIKRRQVLPAIRFGTVPRFRAALHGGSVVAAEIGVDRHKIAYFGDTVNTTARLETLCRDLDEPILISAELLSRITALPPMCAPPISARMRCAAATRSWRSQRSPPSQSIRRAGTRRGVGVALLRQRHLQAVRRRRLTSGRGGAALPAARLIEHALPSSQSSGGRGGGRLAGRTALALLPAKAPCRGSRAGFLP